MKTKFQHNISRFIAIATLLVAPLTSQATPSVTYDIGNGGGSGFGASYLHAATNQMGSSGYFANGNKARIGGTLTFDLHDGTASGSLFVTESDTDFGQGSDNNWTLTFTGSAGPVAGMFQSGAVSSLLSLDYGLYNSGGLFNSGTFYFADRNFAGDANSIGPELYLWGNNWVNTSGGTTERDALVANNGTPLGLDLYGKARSVPEPGMLALLAMGLVGFGVASRKKA